MTLPIVIFAFGGLLLLIGILGGGFEIKGLKIPKVGSVPRLLATIASLFFIVWGILQYNEGEQGDITDINREEKLRTMELLLDDIRDYHVLDEAFVREAYKEIAEYASQIDNKAQGILFEASTTLPTADFESIEIDIDNIKKTAHKLKHAAEERNHKEAHRYADMLKLHLDTLKNKINKLQPALTNK